MIESEPNVRFHLRGFARFHFPGWVKGSIDRAAAEAAGISYMDSMLKDRPAEEQARLEEAHRAVRETFDQVAAGRPLAEWTGGGILAFSRRFLGTTEPPVRVEEWPRDVVELVLAGGPDNEYLRKYADYRNSTY